MELKQVAQRLDDAAEMLPANLSALVRGLPCGVKAQVREIRLRAAKPLAINVANEDLFLLHNGALVHEVESGVVVVSGKEVDECFQRLCDYSVYSHHSEIVGGFITVRNGHRAGLCGTAVVEGGRVTGVRGISSINLRVAREIPGAADEVMRRVFADEVKGMLLCGVPGSGKTTLLRDIAKQLSQRGLRVSVADERGELAAVYCGQAGNDLGPRCDVLDGYPKGEG
ncbi:MAG: type IV secretion system DNA-binding domain-containing protein, partial [Acetanaerobacterium sp.]